MNKVHILDCTLRDGGYCNQWEFGEDNIRKIIKSLIEANIDIIECGFLTQDIIYNSDKTKYKTLKELSSVLPQNREGKMFVAMINYGEFDIEKLPEYDGSSVEGIRVAFHKKDYLEALDYCEKIKNKGYKVFIQAMVSLSYTDVEFLNMIELVNKINPYAFYIVDSFGMMKRKSLIRLFYLIENNLEEDIWIGFHSHNNLQLAYSNAQTLIEAQTSRNLIIDSSIFGMGRGAGNLNTELFVEYLNENINAKYIIKPLLNVIDEILYDFYQKNYWGYSLPNYLSAVHCSHPNYADFLKQKNTLTVQAMDDIFSMISMEKRGVYDEAYIQELYLKYMTSNKISSIREYELNKLCKGKKILLIAPGKSSVDECEKIAKFSEQEDVITVSINFDYLMCKTDFIFVSNLRRFRNLPEEKYRKCIVTSNISAEGVYLKTSYNDLLLQYDLIRDNAGLMAVKFFMNLDVASIYLAGFDGYSYEVKQNYAFEKMEIIVKKAQLDAINECMLDILENYKKQINISFLTDSRYIKF